MAFKEDDSWTQAACMTTYRGKRFDLLNASPEDFGVEDIAHALSNLCRFTGHTKVFFSVAQHSVLISELVPPADALWGLLHDATEAYINDMARPVKHHPAMAEYRKLEKTMMATICLAFHLPAEMPASVKRLDGLMVVTEGRQLLVPPPEWTNGADYLPIEIEPLSPEDAEQAFLNRFDQLVRWERYA